MSINAADINPQLLPRVLRELADCVGLKAALKLAETYPGVEVYVPCNPEPDHPLAQLIGYPELKKLSATYGLEAIRVPNVAVRRLKHALVHKLRQQKLSNREIALRVGYTERRIEQLNSERLSSRDELPADSDSPPIKSTDQPDLFGGW